MFFNQDVSGVSPSPTSASQIASIRSAGGWGNGDTMQIDFSLDVLLADEAAPMRSFEPTDDFFEPDCDHVEMPIPDGGNIEGESGYSCDSDGDCHLLVFSPSRGSLYEMYRADIGSSFRGGCLAVWDTRISYEETLRGEQCTSADAAGFPIAPLLFTADEVAAGEIDHAIRFIIPNDRPKVGYTRPATHGTQTDGDADAPSYGFHLRLRADYPLDTLPSEGARVIARAMQKYGMYHADGGNIALTGQSDRYTTAKWDGLLEPQDLSDLAVEDFEVIDHGEPIELTFDCVR
jgi:serine/threonine-protein kinase